ncbi:MAG: nickel-dependent hydrogenase large subunit [Hyphomicrobiales bacterium]|nr:nickel-dependent hydrogenase large subunit [Hyphomicrobiales bacterium]MDE2115392.1 nickel-dependent hydrogenase large subunit [Hyphomicrobiales bacterium]
MHVASLPGTLEIDVTLAHGQIRSADIYSSRNTGLASHFIGKTGGEIPQRVRQLFSLCGQAQMAAARMAIDHALGNARPRESMVGADLGVQAERSLEILRSCLLFWPWGDARQTALEAAAAPLHVAAQATNTIITKAGEGLGSANRALILAALDPLQGAAQALGLTLDPNEGSHPEPWPGSVFATLLAQCDQDIFLAVSPPDALTAVDDEAVIAALQADPEEFAARPALKGRRIETGAYARLWDRELAGTSFQAGRFLARLRDLRNCLATLRGAAKTGDADMSTSLSGGEAGPGQGFGVVECARGRLYHLASVDANACIKAYAIVAPTEWNFHPAGPFVEALHHVRFAPGAQRATAIARMAATFDPCTAFEITLREAAHA